MYLLSCVEGDVIKYSWTQQDARNLSVLFNSFLSHFYACAWWLLYGSAETCSPFSIMRDLIRKYSRHWRSNCFLFFSCVTAARLIHRRAYVIESTRWGVANRVCVCAYVHRRVDWIVANTKPYLFERRRSWFAVWKVNKIYLFSLTQHKFIYWF